MNGAIIKVSPELLLDWLQFKGGKLHKADVEGFFGELNLYIEHPDLPLIIGGAPPGVVQPTYQRFCDSKGNLISIERIEPPRT